MSEQQFTIAFREALWEAHDKRCFYCREALAYARMEIDHILPERLKDDIAEFEAIRDRLGLAVTFDLNGYENVVASCRLCNNRKAARGIPDNHIILFLTHARDIIPKIEELLDKRRQARDLDQTLRHIARSCDAGRFTPEELIDGLQLLDNFRNGIRGASPDAPPASPEERKSGVWIREENQILWVSDSLHKAIDMGLDYGKLNKLIYLNAAKRAVDVKKLADGRYTLRLDKNIRVIFRPSPSGVEIWDILNYKN